VDGRLRPRAVDTPDRPRENGIARPRILVGSGGSPKSYRLAARYADEYNLTSSSPEQAREKMRLLDDACRAIGRDPSTLARSAMVGALVGADEAELGRRRDAMLQAFGTDPAEAGEWLAARRDRWIAGTPDEARAMVARFAEAGIERVMLQDFLPWDLEMVDLMARELVSAGDPA